MTEDNENNAEETIESADYHKRMSDISGLLKKAQSTIEEVSSMSKKEMIAKAPAEENKEIPDEYRQRMERWNKEGYNTVRLEPALESGIPGLVERVFEGFERDVERLKEVERSLNNLDTTGFRKREADIREALKDPEGIVRTLKHLIELEIDIRRRMEMDI
ncbi:MAG: hypothetical protein KAU14_03295 [Thermoplasmata archaeon]|nr:hypothetical protein [Thermoplasmata archaeon]